MFNRRNGIYLFTAFGVDVSVSVFYLLLMAFIVFWSPGGGFAAESNAVLSGSLFAVAVTISLLVHEYGHAAVSKYFSLAPSILLHGFGGLCFHEEARTDGDDAKILVAGPGVGLIFGGLCIAVYVFAIPTGANRWLTQFLWYMVWISVVWNFVNLLFPIWPLDGGRLFHLVLRRFLPAARARDLALKSSLGTIVLAGAAAVVWLQSMFLGLLTFFLLLNNIQMLRRGQPLVNRPAPKSRGPSDYESEMLEEAREAVERGDWQEAYRLGHQLRGSGGTKTNIPNALMDDIWEILAVASTELGKLDEAETYLDRAPETDAIEKARRAREEAASDADAG